MAARPVNAARFEFAVCGLAASRQRGRRRRLRSRTHGPRPRNLRRADRHRPPLRRRTAAPARGARSRPTTRSPTTSIAEMKEMGLFGLSIAEEYGGLGLTMVEEARVAIELGRTTPAFRSTFGTNVGIGSQGLVMAGTAEQKAQWLPRIASGEIVTSFALTEPDVGSRFGRGEDARGAGRRRLSADRHQALHHQCRQGRPVHRHGAHRRRSRRRAASRAFLVPRDLPGVSIGEPEKKMGQKGAKVADVNFDDVPVPAANRLGAEGEGFKIAMRVLDRGRLHISRGVRRRRRAADRRLRRLCDRAQAVRQADRRASADPGHDRRHARPRRSPPARWCWRPPRRRTRARTS